ncbi:Uncharacterized protein APZ42_018288 [Daphnia magna]|uniref:Uncharacterized protein n=1 Tax=Daphnia magna TaxID=35525 RepID=A0A164Z7E0_9CRUS|nr:Uncharacterized protein APZ42_018288 [Daphnia magna]
MKQMPTRWRLALTLGCTGIGIRSHRRRWRRARIRTLFQVGQYVRNMGRFSLQATDHFPLFS